MREAVWLIAGGEMQVCVAKQIKASGAALILSDRNPNATCRKYADIFLELDTFSVEDHIASSQDVQKKFNITAVLTAAADCHYTVNKLAQHLKLHHLNPEISMVCRNKTLTRELLRRNGIRQPQTWFVEKLEEAQQITANSKTSMVVKATDSSGSRGFAVLEQGQSISLAQFENALKNGTSGGIILEEKLIASSSCIAELSVETLWHNGNMYFINAVDRIFGRDIRKFAALSMYKGLKDGIEIGHINPTNLDAVMKRRMIEEIRRCGKVLGFDKLSGGFILKADIFLTDEGPVVLELTPRSSGGWDSSGSSLARGANVNGGILHLAKGLAVNLEDWFRYFHFSDIDRKAVVLSHIRPDAEDCIGRKFAIASGYNSIENLLELALIQLEKGEFIVPV